MLGSVVLVGCIGGWQALDARGIYKRAAPSVMTLTATERDGESIGTGFMALRSGMAVTAWHVVKGASKVTARFSDGTECEVTGLVAKDEARDIALIRVKADRPLLTLAKGSPEIGSKCFVIGAPHAFEFSISDGIVSQLRVVKGVREVQHSCPQNPGNSGGPLLDAEGHVLGIIDWHLRDSEGLNFAISSSYAREFDLSRQPISWATVSAAASDSEIDSGIAEGITALTDGNTAIQFFNKELVKKPGGFRQAVPAFFFSQRNQLASAYETLSDLKTRDPLRLAAKEEVAGCLRSMIEAMEWLSKSLKVALNEGGWGAEAKATIAHSSPAYQHATVALSSCRTYYSKEGDMSSLSPFVQVVSGLLPDPTGYSIGICSFDADDLQFIEVLPGSFGEKLGFRTGDHVDGVNGQKVDGFLELKKIIKRSLGTTLSVSITRDGVAAEISVPVPDQIPAEFSH